MGLMHNVSANIKRLLAERDMSASEFARLVGVDHAAMSRWLNCKAAPLVQNIDKMAKILGVPVEVLTQHPDAAHLPVSDQEVLQLVEVLRKQGRDVDALLKIISASRKPKKK